MENFTQCTKCGKNREDGKDCMGCGHKASYYYNLQPKTAIHHLDGNITNNKFENLSTIAIKNNVKNEWYVKYHKNVGGYYIYRCKEYFENDKDEHLDDSVNSYEYLNSDLIVRNFCHRAINCKKNNQITGWYDTKELAEETLNKYLQIGQNNLWHQNVLRRFEFKESTHNKYWTIYWGKDPNVTESLCYYYECGWGRIGASPTTKRWWFTALIHTYTEATKRVAEKLNKGYVEVLNTYSNPILVVSGDSTQILPKVKKPTKPPINKNLMEVDSIHDNLSDIII